MRSHAEIKCCMLGPTQNHISPSLEVYEEERLLYQKALELCFRSFSLSSSLSLCGSLSHALSHIHTHTETVYIYTARSCSTRSARSQTTSPPTRPLSRSVYFLSQIHTKKHTHTHTHTVSLHALTQSLSLSHTDTFSIYTAQSSSTRCARSQTI